MNITDKKITIIGGQRSGVALAKLISELKGIPKLSEQCSEKDLTNEFKVWINEHNIEREFEGHTQEFIEDSDMVVLSPGVPINSRPVYWAKK